MAKRSICAFWILPEEENELFEKLSHQDEIVAYPHEWYKNKDEYQPLPLDIFIEIKMQTCMYITFAGLTNTIIVEEHDFGGEIYSGVKSDNANVIFYERAKLKEGNKLTLSNMYATWTRYGNNYEIIDKDQHFVKWGKKVFRMVRKMTPDSYKYKSYRISIKALDAFKQGKIELVEY